MPSPAFNSASRVLLVLVAALALVVSACSSDEPSSSPRTTTTTESGDEGRGQGDGGDGKSEGSPSSSTTAGQGEGGGEPGVPVDLTEVEQPFADALIATWPEQDGIVPFSEAHMICMAHDWVAKIGVERFEAADITSEALAADSSLIQNLDVDEALAGGLVDGMVKCGIDIRALVLDDLDTVEMSDEARNCMEAAISFDAVREMMVKGLAGTQGDEDPMAAASACLDGAEQLEPSTTRGTAN